MKGRGEDEEERRGDWRSREVTRHVTGKRREEEEGEWRERRAEQPGPGRERDVSKLAGSCAMPLKDLFTRKKASPGEGSGTGGSGLTWDQQKKATRKLHRLCLTSAAFRLPHRDEGGAGKWLTRTEGVAPAGAAAAAAAGEGEGEGEGVEVMEPTDVRLLVLAWQVQKRSSYSSPPLSYSSSPLLLLLSSPLLLLPSPPLLLLLSSPLLPSPLLSYSSPPLPSPTPPLLSYSSPPLPSPTPPLPSYSCYSLSSIASSCAPRPPPLCLLPLCAVTLLSSDIVNDARSRCELRVRDTSLEANGSMASW
eukprot:762989-Hanusia_phi.AAC.1